MSGIQPESAGGAEGGGTGGIVAPGYGVSSGFCGGPTVPGIAGSWNQGGSPEMLGDASPPFNGGRPLIGICSHPDVFPGGAGGL